MACRIAHVRERHSPGALLTGPLRGGACAKSDSVVCIEDLPDLRNEHVCGERLVQERHPLLQYSMVHNRVVRVAGHVEHLGLRMALLQFSTSLCTRIDPPLCFTMPYTVARPSPVPCPFGLVVKKGSKIRASPACLKNGQRSLNEVCGRVCGSGTGVCGHARWRQDLRWSGRSGGSDRVLGRVGRVGRVGLVGQAGGAGRVQRGRSVQRHRSSIGDHRTGGDQDQEWTRDP
jgi:hypothetical protein